MIHWGTVGAFKMRFTQLTVEPRAFSIDWARCRLIALTLAQHTRLHSFWVDGFPGKKSLSMEMAVRAVSMARRVKLRFP